MNSVVVYKSKAGFSEKYAKWIAKKLEADLFELSNFSKGKIDNYDTFIYGGGVYASGINGIKFIKNNFDLFRDKKIAVFAVGVSPARDEVVEDVKNKNFTEEELQKLEFFYLRGGFNFNRLGFFDKFLIRVMKKHIMKKEEPTSDDKGMLKAIENPVDFTKKENINKLINYIKK